MSRGAVFRRLAGVALIAASLWAAAVTFRARIPPAATREPDVEEVYLPGLPRGGREGEPLPIFCFFPDRSLSLEPVRRTVHRTADPADELRQAVGALLAGPGSRELLPVFPRGVRLREVYLVEGLAYVDLEVPTRVQGTWGCLMESLAVEALRRTLGRNFPKVERVRILVNGAEAPTLLGHVDVREPLSTLDAGGDRGSAHRDL